MRLAGVLVATALLASACSPGALPVEAPVGTELAAAPSASPSSAPSPSPSPLPSVTPVPAPSFAEQLPAPVVVETPVAAPTPDLSALVQKAGEDAYQSCMAGEQEAIDRVKQEYDRLVAQWEIDFAASPAALRSAKQQAEMNLANQTGTIKNDYQIRCTKARAAAEIAAMNATASAPAPTIGGGTDVATLLAGASLVAQDGTYLGGLFDQYDSQSLFNDYGTYGSKYAASSIWNKYGTYGSGYSQYSAFNQYASSPPILTKNGRGICYLTTNPYKTPGISPAQLRALYF